jgi:restriction system protein
MAKDSSLPTSRQMVEPLVQVLAELDREAHVRELEGLVANRLGLTSEQLSEAHDKSRTEFQYRLAWARTYAKRDGRAISPARNRWQISPISHM